MKLQHLALFPSCQDFASGDASPLSNEAAEGVEDQFRLDPPMHTAMGSRPGWEVCQTATLTRQIAEVALDVDTLAEQVPNELFVLNAQAVLSLD